MRSKEVLAVLSLTTVTTTPAVAPAKIEGLKLPPLFQGMKLGSKVIVNGTQRAGFGQVSAWNPDTDLAEVRYYTNSVSYKSFIVPCESVLHPMLPPQTRCFQRDSGTTRYGRVLISESEKSPLRTYLVHFAGDGGIQPLREDEFSVRSNIPADNPIEIVADLANETPFFFESRSALLRGLMRQNQLAHGLPSLLSSKIDLLPHQVQIAELVLRDPTIRYLLADEVGLGKTIEAGIILRQLHLDMPSLRMAAFVPDQLVRQWRNELEHRFDLGSVALFGHSELPIQAKLKTRWDVVVIDEAHRAVADAGAKNSPHATAAAEISRVTKHLLLLSATPVLHHDTELLALLELLDPENYAKTDIATFRDRTARRILLGRALLALRNATVPPLIKLNAKKLAELLPSDCLIQRLVDDLVAPGADVKALHRELHLHVSETYRIHRRLLRTRRRWIAETDSHYVRDVDERAETEPDENPYVQLWKALDEWRTEVAARVEGSTEDIFVCAAEYIRLAEAISSDPDHLAELVEEVTQKTKATEVEQRLLDELVDPKAAAKMTRVRADLIYQILSKRFISDGASAKYVVFCSSSEICREIAKSLKQHIPPSSIRIADQTANSKDVGSSLLEFAHDNSRVLITDRTGEEGFNLQFARAVIFHDLPWSPMRIEQRLGRLDRIERAGKIVCFDITSGEDEALCLDEVWRRVLGEGFGIFGQSISDLQHAIDAELPHLRERAFLGGPEALASEIEPLKARIAQEREAIEEQDVIDGMHSISPDSLLCRDLAKADQSAEAFADALTDYLRLNIGLHRHWNDEDNSVSFSLPRNAEPIIPVDRLESLAKMLNRPSTFFRNVAAENFDLQFLRPGHPAVDACRDLLAWDDRGCAFVMWREAIGVNHLKCVFRCLVHVHVDLQHVISTLESNSWDSMNRGGLLRMVSGWFPDFVSELFLNENGEPVSESDADICRRPYYNKADVNLGKERAEFVRDECGSATWRQWCVTAADAALRRVSASEEFQRRRDTALAESVEHFALTRTRLAARQRSGIETSIQTEQAFKREDELEGLVTQILNTPVVRLDTIGAYLLSAQPFWEAKI